MDTVAQLQLGKAAVKLALLSSFFNPGGVTFCASSPNSLFADVDVIDQFGELLDHSLGKLKDASDMNTIYKLTKDDSYEEVNVSCLNVKGAEAEESHMQSCFSNLTKDHLTI